MMRTRCLRAAGLATTICVALTQLASAEASALTAPSLGDAIDSKVVGGKCGGMPSAEVAEFDAYIARYLAELELEKSKIESTRILKEMILPNSEAAALKKAAGPGGCSEVEVKQARHVLQMIRKFSANEAHWAIISGRRISGFQAMLAKGLGEVCPGVASPAEKASLERYIDAEVRILVEAAGPDSAANVAEEKQQAEAQLRDELSKPGACTAESEAEARKIIARVMAQPSGDAK